MAAEHASTFIPALVGAAGGLFSGLGGAALWDLIKLRWFVPNLSLLCAPEGEEFVRKANVPGPFGKEGPRVDATYVRVGIRNDSYLRITARSCRVYLTKIEPIVSGGCREKDILFESLRLRWAYEGPDGAHHGGIDLPRGVTLYADILSSQEACSWKGGEGKPKTCGPNRMLEVAAKDARTAPRLVNLVKLNSLYVFTVMVTADGIKPRCKPICIKIGDTWDDVKVVTPVSG